MRKAILAGRVVRTWMGAAFFAVLLYHALTLPGKLPLQFYNVRRDAARAVLEVPQAILKPVLKEVDVIAEKLDKRIESIQKDTKEEVGKLSAQTADVVGVVKQLQADLKPTIDNVNQSSKHLASVAGMVDDALPQFTQCYYVDEVGDIVGGNPDCLFNRFQGVTKAAEKTMQDVQAMTGEIKKAVPPALHTVQRIGENSDKATLKTAEAMEQTRQLMFNLAQNTKPLPAWIRYPAAFVGVAGAATAPWVSVAAATGAFR
jgi:ABC-type transporter Mla subunit MlaD